MKMEQRERHTMFTSTPKVSGESDELLVTTVVRALEPC